ncbi:tetratricopeptide repeat protein [Vogesella fluminis]
MLLGNMYLRGRGVAKNEDEAIKWLRMAARQGYQPAINQLALAEQSRAAGRGDAKAQYEMAYYLSMMGGSQSQVLELLHRSAGQGYPDAQYDLATLYEQGDALPQDLAQAANWYRKAAEQGHAVAQYHLGLMYEQGTGVSKNTQEAWKWYRKAAEQGLASAKSKLKK